MNKQVEQIKSEIERRIENIKRYILKPGSDKRFTVVPEQLSHILSFIGSLEEELLSEDLENKICQLAEEYTLYGQSDYIRLKTVLTNLANWQKWQMMKDVKDATVIMTHVTNESLSPALSVVLLPDTFQEGDKVKVIIVPRQLT
ncbi:MAG: hypothetical protein IKQ37_10435 [Bacteroidaceae bacterium]|nr:hypothetical protein [Bacteroidaceae bacterium]